MKYMLMVYFDEASLSDPDREACYVKSVQLTHDLKREGRYNIAAPLHSVTTATSVRSRNGRRLVTDGPFAETREQLGGFYIVDVEDLDAAVEIAERIPMVDRGTIEIRPVVHLDGLPESSLMHAEQSTK